MPKEYNTLETQKLLRTASTYRQLPNGEMVTMMAAQLELADVLIASFSETTRKLDEKVTNAERQAQTDRTAARTAQEEALKGLDCLELIRRIAKDGKRAKILAAELLVKIGDTKPAVAPDAPPALPSTGFPSLTELGVRAPGATPPPPRAGNAA